MISAFGVDHGSEVSKGKKERAEHYGRMSGTMGTLGVAAGGVGAGAGVVGTAERLGKDPMGFTNRKVPGQKPLSRAARMRVLKPMAAAHGYQAKTLGGLGAASLALAGGYKHKQKKELSKARDKNWKRSASDTAMAGGSAGVAGAALYHGPKNAHFLNQQAKVAENEVRVSHHLLAGEKAGAWDVDPETRKFHVKQRKLGLRVAAVKRPAALAATGAAAAGGAGLYELGRHGLKRNKKKG